MTKIFVSYRRRDSEGSAGRLFDQLIQIFDQADVFMDVDSILPGQNFVNVLDQKLAQTDVMLVVIGPSWLSTNDETGRRRLDKADDFVRIEIAKALNREIAVISILVGGATMPSASDLPETLAELAFRQAVTLRHDSFAHDVKRLTEQIQKFAAEFLIKKPNNPRKPIREFEETIGADFDSGFVMEGRDDDFRLRLHFGSKNGIDTYFNSHLLKDAIVYLIEQADLHGRMKHGNKLQPEAFWCEFRRNFRIDKDSGISLENIGYRY